MLLKRCALLAVLVGVLIYLPIASLSALSLAGPQLGAPSSSHSSAGSLLSIVLTAGALAGVIRIRDTNAIAKKFVQRASVAGGDYAEGVKAGGADWETQTKASEANYVQSVTQAATEGRFGRGVAAAGAAKYVERASTMGVQRYPTGVAAAEGAYARNVQPHLDMMKSLDLPPRKPKGQNQERANIVAAANRKLKLSR